MRLEILSGGFYEGEKVIVKVDGKEIQRRVYWSKDAGDLYVVYKGRRYFYYEFAKGYSGDGEEV